MKKIYPFFFAVFLMIPMLSGAQQMQWLNSTPVNYSFNPETPQQPACQSGNKIYAARLVDFGISYGSDIFGSMAIDCYDTAGSLLWTFPMGQKLCVRNITADASGNVFVAGIFMETLHLNSTDSLLNTGTGFDTNVYLFSLDNTGSLRWKRNMALSHADGFNISCLAIDPQDNCWYGLEYFDSTTITKLDTSGNDLQSHLITGTRTLGSFSFDPSGNIYLAGSAGFPTLTINGFSVTVNEPYMKFISRISATGNVSWIQLVHDVTFLSPQIVATVNGDAFVSDHLLDSAVFGNVIFHFPQWVFDIYLTKVDSAGNFSWGVQVPQTPNITGDFTRGKNNFLATDAAGNVYLTGTVRGSVDWGNGVITDAGVVTNYGNSIISFDGAGVPRWQITGTATGYMTPYSLCVSGPDECYFSSAAVGTTTFGSLTTNQGGNFAFLLGKISSGTSAGVNELSSGETPAVFPNPANDLLTINKGVTDGNAMAIYNALGEKMCDVSSPANGKLPVGLDVSKFPPGIYFLQTKNAGTRFIVQHD